MPQIKFEAIPSEDPGEVAFQPEADTPPTTPHGRFENAFPVWRENFPRSFKFDVEVDPPVPTFGGNLGYY